MARTLSSGLRGVCFNSVRMVGAPMKAYFNSGSVCSSSTLRMRTIAFSICGDILL